MKINLTIILYKLNKMAKMRCLKYVIKLLIGNAFYKTRLGAHTDINYDWYTTFVS